MLSSQIAYSRGIADRVSLDRDPGMAGCVHAGAGTGLVAARATSSSTLCFSYTCPLLILDQFTGCKQEKDSVADDVAGLSRRGEIGKVPEQVRIDAGKSLNGSEPPARAAHAVGISHAPFT
jgi:hypothetical protein